MQCIAQPTNQQHGWIRSDIDGIHDIYPQVYTQLKSEKHVKMKTILSRQCAAHSLTLSSLPHSRRMDRTSLTHPQLTHSFTHSSQLSGVAVAVADSLSLPLTAPLWCSFVRSFVRSFTHNPHSLTSLTTTLSVTHCQCSITHSLTQCLHSSLTFTHSHSLRLLTHSPTHPLTHSPLLAFTTTPPPIDWLLDRLTSYAVIVFWYYTLSPPLSFL